MWWSKKKKYKANTPCADVKHRLSSWVLRNREQLLTSIIAYYKNPTYHTVPEAQMSATCEDCHLVFEKHVSYYEADVTKLIFSDVVRQLLADEEELTILRNISCNKKQK